ncbi:ABC transporter ATP-binding protein [Paracoccus versutus]|uniref:Amino acid/amide ABC transporter ATP-binding protein 2 (HAAT family) n=1 Tax=Paracoccus versutus TaxID=34007 RepID=A0A3D9XSK0_PARVE|nr:ABC transporter ATP-binding protein [Paracoccus versutus]REF73424.1 amino acid/amide ABC transporter ATP-binding protein 2 (HAAT family) [Paracoccus versutus]WGR56456.1 ABC transporter ATP-binding protein [Paracoccus versutus]
MGRMLEVLSANVSYGDMVALRDVSIYVQEGEAVCVIGPNGAGKSTLMTAIAGGVGLRSGHIRLNGESIAGVKPEDIAALGVTMVPEGRHVFGTLTVTDNLRIGGMLKSSSRQIADDIERTFEIFPRLRERSGSLAARLSGGEQQMLVVARGLMTRPRLMMIDEPSLGLAPMITEQIYHTVLEMRSRDGLTLLINEQSSERILKHADRIYVLRGGRVQLEDLAVNLRDGKAISQAYFGFHPQDEGAAS